MSKDKSAGLEKTKRIMARLVKMPPKPHKPLGKKKGAGPKSRTPPLRHQDE